MQIDTNDAPIEFVKHTSGGTQTGTVTGPVSWTVDWIAPAAGAGKARFYASGNAANNAAGSSGDEIYNYATTVCDIPVEAYDYVVNGKPAIEWVIDRQCIKTDKKSGIVNDANDWAIETMNNPKYPLKLLLRVITEVYPGIWTGRLGVIFT